MCCALFVIGCNHPVELGNLLGPMGATGWAVEALSGIAGVRGKTLHRGPR
jgi:hypothetical protein